jgi:two-component system response regulator AtoC
MPRTEKHPTATSELERVETAPSTASRVEAPNQRILVADDNATTCKYLQELLAEDPGAVVDTVGDGREALAALLDRPYGIVITDLKMPRLNGMELIAEVQKQHLPVAVIVTSGFGSIADAVQAMRLGATDFLTKPIDIDHLRLVVRRALRERALRDEVASLREQLQERYSFQNIVSKNPRMHEVFKLIAHVAPATSTVLVEGETGTGKEQIARAVHQASQRTGPFVAVNCAALPETLLESELFGHEKGAFTSAVGQHKGRFELADEGTIFLDEAGDIPPSMQAKLLRVLQERHFERVGGTENISVDVRVIAASNRSLQQLVADGKFREDLYYRLNVVKIDLPPLRDRQEDIPLLVTHFLQKYARPGEPPPRVAPEAMSLLMNHRWPGNIRELENAIERGCVTSFDGQIRPENLPRDMSGPPKANVPLHVDLSRPLSAQLAELVAAFEANYLRKALKESHGHVGRCAEICGLSRRSVTDKLSQYKIDKSEFKAG